MNHKDYQKLAKRCSKHLHALHISLDGVVKANESGVQWQLERSVSRAQQCLARVCGCFDGCEDQALISPLVNLDMALNTLEDGERVRHIERSVREFEDAFTAKQQAPVAPGRLNRGELDYTASLRRRSSEPAMTSR